MGCVVACLNVVLVASVGISNNLGAVGLSLGNGLSRFRTLLGGLGGIVGVNRSVMGGVHRATAVGIGSKRVQFRSTVVGISSAKEEGSGTGVASCACGVGHCISNVGVLGSEVVVIGSLGLVVNGVNLEGFGDGSSLGEPLSDFVVDVV